MSVRKKRGTGVAPLTRGIMSFVHGQPERFRSISPRKTETAILPPPPASPQSKLRRLIHLRTLDSRLEIPVESRKVVLRLLVPAERRAH